jgi:predicted DsbA family dithiol-disulfide isomerase
MTIDVYSDIACPWCYIGERRLAAALAQRPDLNAEVRWRPFQLQPALPPEGVAWPTFADRKFGGGKRARAIFAHVERAAEGDGIAFDFEGIAAAANTADAHRLILLGREEDREWAVADVLFRAYFSEGRDIGDREVLLSIAEEAGVDAERAAAYLDGSAGRAELADSQTEAARLGIQGVPFYVLDGRIGLYGAQPVETFVRALDQALERVG